MHVKMNPDEPGKLIDLVGRIMKIDVSSAKSRLADLTIGGPGFTLRDKISDTEDFTVSVEIPVDPLAKP